MLFLISVFSRHCNYLKMSFASNLSCVLVTMAISIPRMSIFFSGRDAAKGFSPSFFSSIGFSPLFFLDLEGSFSGVGACMLI